MIVLGQSIFKFYVACILLHIYENLSLRLGFFTLQMSLPFSRFVAEHLPLEKIYKLSDFLPQNVADWSPLAMASAIATKKGYLGRRGRPDMHR